MHSSRDVDGRSLLVGRVHGGGAVLPGADGRRVVGGGDGCGTGIRRLGLGRDEHVRQLWRDVSVRCNWLYGSVRQLASAVSGGKWLVPVWRALLSEHRSERAALRQAGGFVCILRRI